MPRGVHMKGRTNNPTGRTRSVYVSPSNPHNPWGQWDLPPVERIVIDLENAGGNISRFLKRITPVRELQESLLAQILGVLDIKDNKGMRKRWNECTARNEKARLQLLEQDVIDSMAPREEDKGKGKRTAPRGGIRTAQEASTLKFMLEKRMPEKYSKNIVAEEREQSEAEKKLLDIFSGSSTVEDVDGDD